MRGLHEGVLKRCLLNPEVEDGTRAWNAMVPISSGVMPSMRSTSGCSEVIRTPWRASRLPASVSGLRTATEAAVVLAMNCSTVLFGDHLAPPMTIRFFAVYPSAHRCEE